MKTISSKEYALNVEDVIWGELKDCLACTLDLLADIHGFTPRTDEMMTAFDEGIAATWRDQTIELFEQYGMDIESDGKEW